jgi:hypothetical protein
MHEMQSRMFVRIVRVDVQTTLGTEGQCQWPVTRVVRTATTATGGRRRRRSRDDGGTCHPLSSALARSPPRARELEW